MANGKVKTNNYSQDERVLVPLTDIYHTADEYTLKLEMPGVAKDKLDVTIEDNELEIRGRVDQYAPEQKELKYSEFSQHPYYRKFTVGNDIDKEKITASFEDGVLTLKLQKSEAVKPRKINISVQ
jgi:HSP20 family protein